MKYVMGAAAAACLLVLAPPAFAQQSAYETQSERVSYSDLDLNSHAGASLMMGRLQAASQRVCGNPRRERSLLVRAQIRACINDALRAGAADTGSATLIAYAGAPTLAFAGPRTHIDRANGDARVYYADLNLASPSGHAALERRVARATRNLCRGESSWRARASCMDSSREEARTQVAAIVSERQLAAATVAAPASEASATSLTAASVSSAIALQQIAASDYGVCQVRRHDAAFGQSSSALGQAARRDINFAVDSASVCTLERAVIAADASSPLAQRRAQTLRAALIARGVSASAIVVEHVDAGAGTNVEMQFAGVATGASPAPQTPAAAGV